MTTRCAAFGRRPGRAAACGPFMSPTAAAWPPATWYFTSSGTARERTPSREDSDYPRRGRRGAAGGLGGRPGARHGVRALPECVCGRRMRRAQRAALMSAGGRAGLVDDAGFGPVRTRRDRRRHDCPGGIAASVPFDPRDSGGGVVESARRLRHRPRHLTGALDGAAYPGALGRTPAGARRGLHYAGLRRRHSHRSGLRFAGPWATGLASRIAAGFPPWCAEEVLFLRSRPQRPPLAAAW